MTIKVTYNVTDVYVSETISATYINISYEAPIGAGAVWGDITGTLSNQTDLQNALNAKFDDPTGTTAQYLRGDGTLATFPTIPSGTVTSVGLTMPSAFSVAGSPVTSSGTLAVTGAGDTTQYIAGDGSLVAFPIAGQSGTLVREVRNVTGATLTKGTVVYINGASGNKPTVAKALATSDATSAQTFGLIQADIPNNSNGYLVAFGDLDGLNTSAFAEGVQLYLSATTAGEYTSVKQYAPNHLVYIGVVTRQHVNQGRIEVRIQNGYELDEIHDVAAQTPSNNDALIYETATALWKNKSIATALGYTPEQPLTFTTPLSRATNTISIPQATTSVSGFLSSTDWTTFNSKQNALTNPITGTGSAGQVAYFTGATTQAGSNNLFWDATNGRLGVGNNSPLYKLDIQGTVGTVGIRSLSNTAGDILYYATGTVTGSLNAFTTAINATGSVGAILQNNNTATGSAFLDINVPSASTGDPYITFTTSGATNWSIGTDNSDSDKLKIGPVSNPSNSSTVLVLHTNGNTSLGATSDSGQRLQVTGDTLLKGSGATTATTALQVQNSGSNDLLNIRNDGSIFLTSNTGARIYPSIAISGVEIGATGLAFDGRAVTRTAASSSFWFFVANNSTAAAHSLMNFGGGFTPTSGTATWNSTLINATINQTGGANGITRGLHVNPTLTAAADWRSIEWSNNSGWGLRGEGTAPNYLAGNLSIGSTFATDAAITIQKVFSGTISYGIYNLGQMQATAANISYFQSQASTSASAITITNLRHYFATTSSFGAGSTVTNQFGFTVQSSLTGATNNYGFYGDLAAATGRWNLYMAGTADNYLNGRLGIGNTTPARRLEVASDGTNWISGTFTGSGGIAKVVMGNLNGLATIGGHNAALTGWTSLCLGDGNVLIASTTDSGEKLQVTGTAKIGGNLGGANQRVANFRNSGGNGYIELQSSGSGAVALWTASGNEFGIYQNATAGTIGTSVFYINSSGNVGVNTFSINASAKLQVESTTQGFLPPRMTTTQKNAIATPAAGLVVYDTTTNKLCCYNGTIWNDLF